MSTIFAPITGRGGAVTVLRLSGPGTLGIVQALAGNLPAPRRASLRPLEHRGGSGWTRRCSSPSPLRTALPARMWPKSPCMAAAPCWRR